MKLILPHIAPKKAHIDFDDQGNFSSAITQSKRASLSHVTADLGMLSQTATEDETFGSSTNSP